jgi:hypothetical protein
MTSDPSEPRWASPLLHAVALRRGRGHDCLSEGENERTAYAKGYAAWWLDDDERSGPDPELDRPHSTRWRRAYETGRVAAEATDRYETEREQQRQRRGGSGR